MIHCWRKKGGKEPLNNHLVDFQFRFGQGFGQAGGGDDRKVIGDFFVIKNPFILLDIMLVQGLSGKFAKLPLLLLTNNFFHGRQVVFRQAAAVGPWVGDQLVPFVQGLRKAERVFSRKTEPAVGLALQQSKIIKGRRAFGGLFTRLLHRSRFAEAQRNQCLGSFFFPETIAASVGLLILFFKGRVDPDCIIVDGSAAETGVEFPVGGRNKFPALGFPLDQKRQGRCLHPAAGRFTKSAKPRIVAGECPGGIDTDQPVGLGAAECGILQGAHLLVIFELAQTITNGVQGHGLQPQPSYGLSLHRAVGRLLEDIFKNQLSLATGVTAVDNHFNIFSLDQFGQGVELGLGFRQHGQGEFFGQDGQVIQGPLVQLRVDLLGVGDGDQMTNGIGDHILITFKMSLVFNEFPREGLDDI